jgi:hypothetical protein
MKPGQPAKPTRKPSRSGSVHPRSVNEGVARQKASSYQFPTVKPAALRIAILIRRLLVERSRLSGRVDLKI